MTSKSVFWDRFNSLLKLHWKTTTRENKQSIHERAIIMCYICFNTSNIDDLIFLIKILFNKNSIHDNFFFFFLHNSLMLSKILLHLNLNFHIFSFRNCWLKVNKNDRCQPSHWQILNKY